MVYNFNLGIGWASSGVEYAQSYRGIALRKSGIPAKFIFTDMFPRDPLEHMTKNLYFEDDEIIWLYTFFTDFKIAPVTYTKEDLEKTFPSEDYTYTREGKVGTYRFHSGDIFYRAYFTDYEQDFIHRVEYVSGGNLIRKDYFSYARMYTEYYAPENNKAKCYMRRFYNTDGTTAYEEVKEEDREEATYHFPDRIIDSKTELVGYMIDELHVTENDYVLMDRTTFLGQIVLEHARPAKIGVVIHADHYSKGVTNEDYILWNNYYENAFRLNRFIDFYIVSTDQQRTLLLEQFEKYNGVTPKIITIPVGSLPRLRYPSEPRKRYSMLTASRLAAEKHCDYDIKACVKVHEALPDITLDIYGEGKEKTELSNLIHKYNAENYIRLMGQHNLEDVYKKYELYLTASRSEGFGLSLLEAIGSGLPIVGFDVPYGNPTFVDEGQNGHLFEYDEHTSETDKVQALANMIIKIFTEDDIESFHQHSYDVASKYLDEEVRDKWAHLFQ